MDTASTGFLNNLLQQFSLATKTGVTNLLPMSMALVTWLGIIDLCSTWTLYEGQLRISNIISRVLKICFILFVLANWVNGFELAKMFMNSFEYAGWVAAGLKDSSSLQNMSPSMIIERGFEIVRELWDSGSGFSTTFIMHLLGILLTLFAFFFIAFQLLLIKIEFQIFCVVAALLLPFSLLKITSRFSGQIISSLFNFGTKLMILYFVLGLSEAFIKNATVFSANPSAADMLKQCVSMGTVSLLVWKTPHLAGTVFSGGGALSAIGQGMIGSTARAAGAGAAVSAGAGLAATSAAAKTFHSAGGTQALSGMTSAMLSGDSSKMAAHTSALAGAARAAGSSIVNSGRNVGSNIVGSVADRVNHSSFGRGGSMITSKPQSINQTVSQAASRAASKAFVDNQKAQASVENIANKLKETRAATKPADFSSPDSYEF